MQTRTEAMRAAGRGYATTAATAGADAELAQLERWLDAVPVDARDNSVLLKLRILRTIRARAHWPKESGDD